jgi:hypothetical protein
VCLLEPDGDEHLRPVGHDRPWLDDLDVPSITLIICWRADLIGEPRNEREGWYPSAFIQRGGGSRGRARIASLWGDRTFKRALSDNSPFRQHLTPPTSPALRALPGRRVACAVFSSTSKVARSESKGRKVSWESSGAPRALREHKESGGFRFSSLEAA